MIHCTRSAIALVVICLTIVGNVFAQMQPDIPQPRGPVNLRETSNLVLFIILPALVLIGYFFWRRATKRRENKGE
jgi:RsiW-degrading membrane proteinase PrsW (M82 family)